MKTTSAIALLALSLSLICSCKDAKPGKESKEAAPAETGTYAGPPYTVQLQEFVNPKLPDLHSYTHAVWQDKIVMFGGRTNGLHGGSYLFHIANSNKTVYVVDTKNWGDPAGWEVHSMPDTRLALNGVDTRQFRANNAEYFTRDSVLYVIGGTLGANVPTKLKDPNNLSAGLELVPGAKPADGSAPTQPSTLPYLTAFSLPALVNAVMNNQPMPPNSMRQVRDSGLTVTGGEVSVIDNTVYLVFGWNFFFSTPPDWYTHQVRTFTVNDDGKTLSVSPITVFATDGQPDTSLAGNFRRRDGSMSAMIDPADGSQGLLYYSGVFKNGNTNFNTAVWIGKNGAAEDTAFTMRSNVYTCQVIPVYSKSRKESYGTLLGGMTDANYTDGVITKPTLLTAANAPLTPPDTTGFTSVPFSNQFTTVSMNARHTFAQYLLPDSFPRTRVSYVLPFVPAVPADTATKTPAIPATPPYTLPADTITYNGAESELIWTLKTNLMPNGVIDYDALIAANPAGATIGYLHGGIMSVLANVFGNKAAHYSIASNRIFAVRIVPLKP